MMTVESTVVATPVNVKVPQPPFPKDEAMSEKENRILRSSDALNKQQPDAENPSLPPEAGNEKKRKGGTRNVSIGGEQENSGVVPGGQNAGRKRSLPAEREARLKRKSTEPPPQVKNLVRSTASSRAAATATHKAAPSSRVAKQQPGGNKTRGWVR
jgi:kinesin family protein C2/C3